MPKAKPITLPINRQVNLVFKSIERNLLETVWRENGNVLTYVKFMQSNTLAPKVNFVVESRLVDYTPNKSCHVVVVHKNLSSMEILTILTLFEEKYHTIIDSKSFELQFATKQVLGQDWK